MGKYKNLIFGAFLMHTTPSWTSTPANTIKDQLKDLENHHILSSRISNYCIPYGKELKGKHTYRMIDGTLVSIDYNEWPDAPEAVDSDPWPETPDFGDYED